MRIERSFRTDEEEFYQVPVCRQAGRTSPPIWVGWSRPTRAWNRTYETVRPHQALGYLSAARQERPRTSSITTGSIPIPREKKPCPICPDPIQTLANRPS